MLPPGGDDEDEDGHGGGKGNDGKVMLLDTSSSSTAATPLAGRQHTGNSKINYNELFTTAEREYQRMQAHEESNSLDDCNERANSNLGLGESDIEEWLDREEDDNLDDEGATVVIGRAQFFMGAMRDYVGMPASSSMDAKNRIMRGGVSAVVRRRGSKHRRLPESWDAGDYGQKDQDHRT